MKKAGQPWEKAKGFDNACPISGFVPVSEFTGDPQDTTLSLKVNGEIRQQGTTADMIHKIVPLIARSRFFTLKPGDVILTGTPEGVGPLTSGSKLDVSFNGLSLKTLRAVKASCRLKRAAKLASTCQTRYKVRFLLTCGHPDERHSFLAKQNSRRHDRCGVGIVV